jgi:Family of unknown function (DUF6152)
MEMRIAKSEFLMCGILLLVISAPTSAHHSAAGYDMAKTLTAPATIKEFRWGAPHSSAVFVIKGTNGKPEEVTMASAAPGTFMKQGFKPRDFKVGDKVEITWHPSKSGAIGGQLDGMKLPDGRTFKETEFAPGGPLASEAAKQIEATGPAAPAPRE